VPIVSKTQKALADKKHLGEMQDKALEQTFPVSDAPSPAIDEGKGRMW